MRILLFNALLCSICGYSLWRGGAPERVVAVMLLAAAFATRMVSVVLLPALESVEVAILAIDVVLLAGLLIVALRADRYWPMTITALQIVAVGVHLAKMINPGMVPWVYAVALGLWGYPIIAVLGWGTFQHQKRLRAYGADAPWSRSSGGS